MLLVNSPIQPLNCFPSATNPPIFEGRVHGTLAKQLKKYVFIVICIVPISLPTSSEILECVFLPS